MGGGDQYNPSLWSRETRKQEGLKPGISLIYLVFFLDFHFI